MNMTPADERQPTPVAQAPTVVRDEAGQVNGTAVDRYTLTNAGGMRVQVLSYGGIIQSLEAPDRDGHTANVVLGFPTVADYVEKNSPAAGGGVYFGALIGRFANRIAKGTFSLDGQTYHVPVNNNGNALHGGTSGFDHQVWTATEVPGADTAGIRLSHVSPDGEQGFPGTLSTTVTYLLDNDNRLTVHYEATTDAPTVVNLTNHTYWNLTGEGSGDVYRHELTLNADHFTPTDSTQIPTGEIAPVAGTPMDFRTPTAIGARLDSDDPQILIGQGYDHNWVLNRDDAESLSLAARVVDPDSGRVLTVRTTAPGVQFYGGNFLTGTLVGPSGRAYRKGYGFALETQHFPDSPNHPHFPSTVLRPGETYRQTTVFELGTD